MRILCVGLNHKTAAVAIREKVSFTPETAACAYRELLNRWPAAEIVILSTCNRTELYIARPVHDHPRQEEISHWLGEFHRLGASELDGSLYLLADGDAAEHLFSVAAGLDSMVLGETQVLGQVKAAYAAAVDAAAARAVMNELFQDALHVAKHICSETKIAAGRVSVASAAIDCVSQSLGSLSGKCVLNIGAGKMNVLMLKHLADLGANHILVTNRSADKAKELAAAAGVKHVRSVPFEMLQQHIEVADVIVTSTAAPTPILTAGMIEAAQKKRGGRPLLIVDIAVPRDVESAAASLRNVFLYNIDDLERIVQATIESRARQLEPAQKIIRRHATALLKNLNVRHVAPTIESLYAYMRLIAEEELDGAKNKLSSHKDAHQDAEIVKLALHRTIRRIMHPLTKQLRHSAGSDAARAHVATIRKLFELDS